MNKNARNEDQRADRQAFSTSQLELIRSQLAEQRSELLQRLEAIKRDVERPLSADSKEQAIDLENAPVLNELAREASQELAEIAEALRRMDSGTYGQCVSCGQAIDLARLKAYPGASSCVACPDAG